MPAKRVPTFTIRDAEAHSPCISGYIEALQAIKSKPVPGGDYDGGQPSRKSKSRYGPDDEIPITEVLGAIEGFAMHWIVTRLLPGDTRRAIADRAEEIENNAIQLAIQELYGKPKARKRK